MDLKSFAETYWSIQEKKLDPVGKEDGDVDNDGDKDSSDSYLMKRRKAIAKAMKKEEVEKEETEVVEHHQKDANGKVIEHEDEAPGTPSSVEEEKTVLEQLTENGREIDTFEAVISYLIDEGFAKYWEEAQDIMITLKPELIEEVYQNQLVESEKLARKAYERAQTLGARRRSSYEYRKKGSFGPGKNERAGYNLSQSQQSRNVSPATQGGNQTGGGAKSFGFARDKSNPIKSRSGYDSGAEGHRKKRDEKVTMKKDGKTPLKTPRYKMSAKQRMDHHSSRRQELRDPKKNPKHEANKKK